MKITHIFKTYFPETNGGLEEAIRQIGRHAVREGFEVEVVSVGKTAYTPPADDGITTRFYACTFDRYSNPFSLSLARDFKAICENTDIVHLHFPWPTAELLTLLTGVKTPIVVTYHCDIHKNRLLKALYMPVIKRFLSRADRVCVTSRNLMETTPYLRRYRDKSEEIHLWFDNSRFSGLPAPRPEIVSFADKLGKFALFVGVLRWYKGLDVLLDAAKAFSGDVVVVGKGPLHGHLSERVRREGISNLHLAGFLHDPDLKHLLERCRMVVLPSITPAEAFGQILLEGLNFSKPLVSTELGTATSLVNRHGHTGLVVPPGRSDALARAMGRIAEEDALHARFSQNALPHYRRNFTAESQGEKYIAAYRSLMPSAA